MFRTSIKIKPSPDHITLSDQILCVGSCFAQSIGKRLQENKLKATVNPFGIIFNPVSIVKLLSYCLDQKKPKKQTYIDRDGIYYNYDFHSQFSAPDEPTLTRDIEHILSHVYAQLHEVDWMIFTLGTAYVHEKLPENAIVANCHKQPSSFFQKRLLSKEEIVGAMKGLIDELITINPQMKIVVTVSPVRHLREGLENNMLSKSVLRLACDELRNQYESVNYFPAFEILMDDLRDYRFYAEDMLHPSKVAEDYIWKMFSDNYFADETLSFVQSWGEIRKSLSHHAFQGKSDKHQNFLKKLLAKLYMINDLVDVSKEINDVESQLAQ